MSDIREEGVIYGKITAEAELSGAITIGENIDGELGLPSIVLIGNDYEGPYNFTPSAQTQEIDISGKRATENIIINPIPQNYGLITWNGAFLTVS